MVSTALRHGANLVLIAALFGCGSDGPVGPSASTTSTTTTTAAATSTSTTTSVPLTISSTTTSSTTVPIVISSTTTTTVPIIVTIVTTSTTTAAVSFAAVVWPNMAACDACHTEFNTAATAYTFAFTRSASNSLNSLFYRKPTGGCTPASSCAGATPPSALNATGHGGGTSWPAGSAGAVAAAQWINGGRGM